MISTPYVGLVLYRLTSNREAISESDGRSRFIVCCLLFTSTQAGNELTPETYSRLMLEAVAPHWQFVPPERIAEPGLQVERNPQCLLRSRVTERPRIIDQDKFSQLSPSSYCFSDTEPRAHFEFRKRRYMHPPF